MCHFWHTYSLRVDLLHNRFLLCRRGVLLQILVSRRRVPVTWGDYILAILPSPCSLFSLPSLAILFSTVNKHCVKWQTSQLFSKKSVFESKSVVKCMRPQKHSVFDSPTLQTLVRVKHHGRSQRLLQSLCILNTQLSPSRSPNSSAYITAANQTLGTTESQPAAPWNPVNGNS